MIQAGSGKADITPPIGLPLSGFAVRQNRPSTAVDDPLVVKALAISAGNEGCLLLSFDLLGFDQVLDVQLRTDLLYSLREQAIHWSLVITTTHTHSGPATMPIAGETRVPETYIQKILQASKSAAAQAISNLGPAVLLHAAKELEGINHNRREKYAPGMPQRQLPLDRLFDLFVFRGADGVCRGSLARFSCHAVTMTTQHISADYPGELTRRLEDQLGAPCLFLEGTAGDSNPTTHGLDHAAMLKFVDEMMVQLADLPGSLRAVEVSGVQVKSRMFSLPYAAFPTREQVLDTITRNDRILGGDLASADLQPLIKEYAGWRSAEEDDIRGTILHWAQVYRQSALLTLDAVERPQAYQGIPFQAAVLKLGAYLFTFLSGEILTQVGTHIQALQPGAQVKVISYLSPIAGYIGDAGEYELGGYELDNAWLWYRQPGPFDRNIETVILEQVSALFSELTKEQS